VKETGGVGIDLNKPGTLSLLSTNKKTTPSGNPDAMASFFNR